jgi:ABC-type uncharacterized transport system ATPase subunit
MMVGREVVLRVEKSQAKPKEVLLSIKNLRVSDDRKLESVKDLSLEVHAGEILGIAGVEGNGQRELVEAICSMRSRLSGEVIVKGKAIPNLNPRAAHLAGVSHIPEDREKHGLVTSYSIADNLVLNRFDQKFDIRAPNAYLSAGSLSGGNKQKVVVARELSQQLDVVVAAQPTRGVDVGSIEFIHNQLIAARDAGAAVLLVSAELDEILSLADRIAVISNGKIVAIFNSKEADRNTIGRLMAGLAS